MVLIVLIVMIEFFLLGFIYGYGYGRTKGYDAGVESVIEVLKEREDFVRIGTKNHIKEKRNEANN